MLKENTIHLGDCLDLMPTIPSKCVDMILCDLPYGNTSCSWDSIIPLDRLWKEYTRIIKDNGVIVLTANAHFVFTLHASNPQWFRYEWIWEKSTLSGFLNANIAPLRNHETILVFYNARPTYNPQTEKKIVPYTVADASGEIDSVYGKKKRFIRQEKIGYPKTILRFSNGNTKSFHPTQKPVALFEYLIRTYTNENELVLDNCSGAGTTAIACMNTNRRFICIEKDAIYHKKSIERMNNHEPLLHLSYNDFNLQTPTEKP